MSWARSRPPLRALALAASLATLAHPAGSVPQTPPCSANARICPDLRVLEVRPEAEWRQAGYVVVVTVENAGTAGSTHTELDVFLRAWDRRGAESVGPLAARASSLPIDVLVPGLEDHVGAEGDALVRVAAVTSETERGNNWVRLPVSVPPVPDLSFSDVTPELSEDRSALEVRATVVNEGTGPSGPTKVGVTVTADGWEEPEENLPAIDPAGSRVVQFSLPVPESVRGEGLQEFTIAIDGERAGEPAYLPPDNNTHDFTRAFGVLRVDLAVVGEPSHSLNDDGTELTIDVDVINRGRRTSPEVPVRVSARGWTTQTKSLDPLARNAQGSLSFDLDVADDHRGKTHEFTIVVDSEDTAEDRDPENNDANLEVAIPSAPPPPTTTPTDTTVSAPTDGSSEGWDPLVTTTVSVGGALVVLAGIVLAFRLGRRAWPGQASAPPGGPLPGRERVVSTGFAPEGAVESPLDPDTTLACGELYYFWFEIGAPVAGSIERQPAPAAGDALGGDARLVVALFSLGGGMKLGPPADVGEIQLTAGTAHVVRQPDAKAGATPDLAGRRLLFPLRAPDAPGAAQLRCNVYHRGTLLQSRLVRAQVLRVPERSEGALSSTVDYTLAPSLDPAVLCALPEQRLALMLNRNADGTHGLSFFGERGSFKSEASLDGHALQDLIAKSRGALRRASWGDEDEWREGKDYLYERPSRERLEDDLVHLARRGYRSFSALVDELAGGPDEADRLGEIMREPGLVQVASRDPRLLVPAALFYDYDGFDSTFPRERYSLCPDFVAALDGEWPLEEVACFRGRCPMRGSETVVCPSGFWGYRHALGLPLSVGDALDAPAAVAGDGAIELAVLVSTDPDFVLREAHERVLRGLRDGVGWSYAATRADALRLLGDLRAQIVYFYCHGGLEDGTPYLLVGSPGEQGITPDRLRSLRVRWQSRPLVFINGCRTTALEPARAIEFVSMFVSRLQAAGVVGTETTIFEPLASAFAESCLRRLLAGAAIGEAVRGARLELLKAGNPLGLVYVPFALAGLRVASPSLTG